MVVERTSRRKMNGKELVVTTFFGVVGNSDTHLRKVESFSWSGETLRNIMHGKTVEPTTETEHTPTGRRRLPHDENLKYGV